MNSKILCNLPVKDSDNIVWASLVAQKVKKLPAMQKTWVRSLGWEDPLEEGLATHSSIQIWALIMNPEILCGLLVKESDNIEIEANVELFFYH